MSRERLQKILARAGLGSRRQAEEIIREGRVTVNGRMAVLGEQADPAEDAIKVDGRRVLPATGPHRYLLLHKPQGFVSTVRDPEGRSTVLDLLPHRLRAGLFPVGRLDFDSEGLLLLTDDGDFAQHVAHPRYGCHKTYEVKVKGRPTEEGLQKLRRGILLEGRRTAPARIAPLAGVSGPREGVANTWWSVTLQEGRPRQIREMFFRIGHPVSRLRRVAIGPLRDPSLARGAWRELSEAEVKLLLRKTATVKPKSSEPPAGEPAPAKRGPRGRKPAARKPPGRSPVRKGGGGTKGAAPGARGKGRPSRGRPRR